MSEREARRGRRTEDKVPSIEYTLDNLRESIRRQGLQAVKIPEFFLGVACERNGFAFRHRPPPVAIRIVERLGERPIPPGFRSPVISVRDGELWDLLRSELHPVPGRKTGRAAWRPDGTNSTVGTQTSSSICEFFCRDAYSKQPRRGNDPPLQT